MLLLSPYHSGSHKQWAEGLIRHSKHKWDILTLAGKYWKWRMHGAAISLADKINALPEAPEVILCTDMLDLSLFKARLKKEFQNIPIAIYFHENQMTYPWSPEDRDIQYQRDHHYAYINYVSALCADQVFFNSQYHLDAFFDELPLFLNSFPSPKNLYTIDEIKRRSSVLHLGLDLKFFECNKPDTVPDYDRAVILWNHRWEYDKNPEDFFKALYSLDDRGIEFKLIILGENFSRQPEIFEEAKGRFSNNILHYGFAKSRDDYAKWLWHADILPVTSLHDFFGASVIEAMACNVIPLLPKRLAYPEHIPSEYSESFFYDDQYDLVNRLQRMIMNVRILRKQKTSHFVMHYDWSNSYQKYDDAMSGLINP